MGAQWKIRARKAGYDPAKVKDAPKSWGKLVGVIEPEDMKGAVIGDGEHCSGSNCLKRVEDVDWAFIGATTAHIAPKGSKRIYRFLVNGIARKQDRTMNVVGEKIILRPPTGSQTMVAFQTRPKNKTGQPKTARRVKQRSLAGMLRAKD